MHAVLEDSVRVKLKLATWLTLAVGHRDPRSSSVTLASAYNPEVKLECMCKPEMKQVPVNSD